MRQATETWPHKSISNPIILLIQLLMQVGKHWRVRVLDSRGAVSFETKEQVFVSQPHSYELFSVALSCYDDILTFEPGNGSLGNVCIVVKKTLSRLSMSCDVVQNMYNVSGS